MPPHNIEFIKLLTAVIALVTAVIGLAIVLTKFPLA